LREAVFTYSRYTVYYTDKIEEKVMGIRKLIIGLIMTTPFIAATDTLAEESPPFTMTAVELIEKGVEQSEGAYVASGVLRCGSLLRIIDAMSELSFGEPVFEGAPGDQLSALGYRASVKLANDRGSKYTQEELMQSVLNEQTGYDKIYMMRMQNNKVASGDFYSQDQYLMTEMKECLEIAKAFK